MYRGAARPCWRSSINTLSSESHEGWLSYPLLFLLQPSGMEDASCENKPLIVRMKEVMRYVISSLSPLGWPPELKILAKWTHCCVHILILTFKSADEMCVMTSCVCLANITDVWSTLTLPPSVSGTVDGEHPPSWSSLKLFLFCLFPEAVTALTELPFTLRGCKFGSLTIDTAPLRFHVAGGQKWGIVVFFCTADIDLNVWHAAIFQWDPPLVQPQTIVLIID